MALIACIADSHFDEALRFDECIRIHHWIADQLEDQPPDVICHSGDVFHRKSTPAARLAVAQWLRRCADIAPVVIARGNHDVLGDLPIFSRLRGKHPVIVEEAAGVHVVGGVAIAALAWPRKSEILARLPDASHDTGEAVAAEALRAVLRGLGVQLAQHDGPRLLLAHAMVRASRVSTGQPLVGCDFELGLEDLALCRADAYLLGHVHMGQEWRIGESPVIYPGSPRRTDFGETEEKSYVLVETANTRLAVTRAETPSTPMLRFQDEWGQVFDDRPDMGWRVGDGPANDLELRGAEVRFRYFVDADRREEAKAAAERLRDEWLAAGAFSVKIEEEVRPVNRARLPEVSRARTLAEKIEMLWSHRGFDPGPRRASLMSKLGELEEAS